MAVQEFKKQEPGLKLCDVWEGPDPDVWPTLKCDP